MASSYYNGGVPQQAQPALLGASKPEQYHHSYEKVPSPYVGEFPADVEKDQLFKKRIRILKFVARTGTACLSVIVLAFMVQTVVKYESTKNTQVNGRTPWAKNTKTWPTLMLLGISAASTIINLCILIAYCFRSQKNANRISTMSSIFSGFVFAGHVVVWATTAGVYRYTFFHLGNHDIWGWTCSDTADKIQAEFQNIVDFNHFCNSNTNSWYISIAQAAFEIFTLVAYIFAFRRLQHRRKMKRASEAASSGYHM